MGSDTDLWEEAFSSSLPNDFIGYLSPEAEQERQAFWERETARHEAAEVQINTFLSELEEGEEREPLWDGLVDLGNGIRG